MAILVKRLSSTLVSRFNIFWAHLTHMKSLLGPGLQMNVKSIFYENLKWTNPIEGAM